MLSNMKNENNPIFYSDIQNNPDVNSIGVSKIFPTERELNGKFPANSLFPLYGNCLIDHSGRQYTCIHKHCLDDSRCFKNELPDVNFDFQALQLLPEDRQLWCEEAFPDILSFFDSLSVAEHSDYRFSFNHRYIHKDGNISQFLHEGTLIFSNDNSLPVLSLKVFTEIGDIKTDETIVLSIFRYSADQGYQKVFTKVYGETHNSQLSQREIEIIRLCLEGLSSKMIADKLSLSIHTVKNHKRNCMEKTLTHNIAELINLCIRSRWV